MENIDVEDAARELAAHLRSIYDAGTLIRNGYPGTVIEVTTREGWSLHVIVREGHGSDRGPVRVD